MKDWGRIRDDYGLLVWKTVYRILANHADALDCCQDVFTELIRRTNSPHVSNWPAYLRCLATSRAVNRLKRRRVEAQRIDLKVDVASLSGTSSAQAREIEWNELVACLRAALIPLPEKQAAAFWLHAVEELSYLEIGEQMGIEANAVGVLVHRARQRLRQALAEFKPLGQAELGSRCNDE